jgi:hypothetical protein
LFAHFIFAPEQVASSLHFTLVLILVHKDFEAARKSSCWTTPPMLPSLKVYPAKAPSLLVNSNIKARSRSFITYLKVIT